MTILFLKARLPGAADLFAATTQVAGYTREDGIFVGPHAAIRHKRTLVTPLEKLKAAPAQADLFAPPAPAPAAAAVRSKKAVEGQSDLFAPRPAAAAKPATVPAENPADAAAPTAVERPRSQANDEAPAAKGAPVVPESVRRLVRAALDKLREVRDGIEQGRATDAKFDGYGRYENDAIENTQAARDAAMRMLAVFREKAGGRGVDAEAVIKELGGVPDIAPSAAAAAYKEGVAPAKPEAGKPASSERPAREPGKAAKSPRDLRAVPADEDDVPLARFGVPAGVSANERRRLNAAARDLLASKGDAEMTAADKAVLAQYSGNGGCGDSINEFYTDPAVASAMWGLLERAGFKGGAVLEPSSGTGVFLHTAPKGAAVTAVELDPTSSRICGILHGTRGHTAHNASLERFATQDGTLFDAVIGNCPFGLRGSMIRDDKSDLPKAEQYFLDTGLDKLKDGGLLAMIVPTGVMDSQSGRRFRDELLRKGEFLGASRLPNTAFEASHTGVTSDVLLFRKRPQEVAGALSTLSPDQIKDLGLSDPEFVGGGYFTGDDARGAPNIHGRLEPGWRAKAGMGNDVTVEGSMQGVPDAVRDMPIEEPKAGPEGPPSVPQILASLGDDEHAKRRAVSAALKPPYQLAKLGDIKTVDGVRYVLQGDPPRWHRVEEPLHPAVEHALRVAEAIDDLHENRARDPDFTRTGLIEDLDSFVAQHGVPARNKHLRTWLAGPSMPNSDGADPSDTSEASLRDHGERVKLAARRAARLLGAVGEDGTYSDLVTGRRRETAALDLDTVATKLSLEQGGFAVGELAVATGKRPGELLDHLYASAAFAVDPDGTTWHTADTYMAGELWAKYDAARAAAAASSDPALAAKWRAQAEALELAIAPASLEDVEITVGAGFITPELLTDWFVARNQAWRAENPDAKWEGPAMPRFAYSADDAVWSVTRGMSNGDAKLLLQSLNRTGVRKDDKDKLDRLNKEFGDWLRGSEHRGAVEDRYNRTYRGYRAPAFSDSPIAIPGLNSEGLKSYQYSGLRWALQAGSGIIAADVGLGKTVRGLMLAKLLKSGGSAKKPVFVVPKSVLANWVAEAEKWFPGSNVMTIGESYVKDKAGNTVSKPDDEATKRAKYHQLQQNDFDFVFISQPSWNDLDVNPVMKGEMADADFWAKRGDALGSAGDKRLNQIRTAHEQALASRDFKDREQTIYFDDLGIDALIMDEGHAYKNLYSAKNRFGENPKFLGGSGLSNRAQDTFFKTKALRDANDGRGVFLLTATPTKNSPLEIYSMLSHIAPEAFERMGIRNSEDFLDRFCEFTNDTVMTVDGKTEEALVTSGFKNLDELREVMRRYIDRKTAADVGLVIPKGQPVDHYIDMTPRQEETYHELRAAYVEATSGGQEDATGDSHIFSIMSRMGKASIDLSMLEPDAGDAHMPKVDACVAEAVKNAGEGGQVIFCDHVDVHEKVAAKLMAAGVPRSQIGIINARAAASSADRQRICDRFNKGDVRYVIGNTATMGEGVNLQKGTTDIHHLDLPWEPASVQQRNGRGVRQGNNKESVRLHSYLAKASFDGYRLQTVSAKKDWQDLLWNGGDKVENLARAGMPSRQDMMIQMSANPEETAAKFAADKAAAMERRKVEDRASALDAFAKLGKMNRALGKLQAEKDPLKVQTAAIVRLERKRAALREALRDMRGFEHKDLIDGTEPAAIEPVTGHAWLKGRGFVLAGGSDGPIHYSEHDTRFVVTAADPDAGTVTARPYGTAHDRPVTLQLDRMKDGVTPFAYDEKEEQAARDAEQETLRVAEGRRKEEALHSGRIKLDELRDLPKHVLEKQQQGVQNGMRKAIEAYQDGHRQYYGLLDPSGQPVAVPNYSVRDLLKTHSLVLPVPEHKAKAIDAYVAAEQRRSLMEPPTPAKSTRWNIPSTSRLEAKYKEPDQHETKDNPWGTVLEHVWGPEAVQEGKAALHDRTVDAIKAAPNLRDAMVHASAAVDVPPWGSWDQAHQGNPWPAKVARALASKARSLGQMDSRVSDAAAPGRASSYVKTDLHPKLYVRGGTDYSGAASSAAGKYRTVREFMTAIAHPDDADVGVGTAGGDVRAG